MINRKIKAVGKKFGSQVDKLLGREKKSEKRQFVEAYITTICYAVPEVSREDVGIIVTGFISELRRLDSYTVSRILGDSA